LVCWLGSGLVGLEPAIEIRMKGYGAWKGITNRATQRRSSALLNALAMSPAWVHFVVR
jgi:hypothetical protein